MPVIGTQQSPVRIESTTSIYVPFGSGYLTFNYSGPLYGRIDGTKRIFVFDPPGDEDCAGDWSITVSSAPWLIRQIHLHAHAEHLVDTNQPNPFEAHLVHSRPHDPEVKGEKLVVGVFVRPGVETREKKSLDKFLEAHARRAPGSAEPGEVDPRDFLPDSGLDRFFRYEGSLTGSPFTEDVSWFVMCHDGAVDPRKFNALEKYAEQEPRPIQVLNRRFVLKSFL